MKKSILIITLFLLALATTPAFAQAPEGEAYVIQAGDSLSAIAAREYGNSQAFPAIIAATNAKAAEDDTFATIAESGVVVVGQKLWLPADPDVEAAAPSAQTPAQPLYMPSNVQRAFDNGSRSPDGNPGETYWQNRSEHSMTINITPPDRTIVATEEITYYNNSPFPLPSLAIRLYLNVHQPEA